MGLPRASAARWPVSASATALVSVTRPRLSATMTASPIEPSVVRNHSRSARRASSTALRLSSMRWISLAFHHTTAAPVTMAESTTRDAPTMCWYWPARIPATRKSQPSAMGRSTIASSRRRAMKPAGPCDATTRMKPLSGRKSRVAAHSSANATPLWSATSVSGLCP